MQKKIRLGKSQDISVRDTKKGLWIRKKDKEGEGSGVKRGKILNNDEKKNRVSKKPKKNIFASLRRAKK